MRFHTWGTLLLMAVLALYFSGCSTIYGRQNDHKNIYFTSNVDGTQIGCRGENITTPGNILLRQSQTHRCHAYAEGYESKTVRVHSGISKEGFRYSSEVNWKKWGIWTLGIGNLVGWTVDFISGSMRDFKQDRYDIQLKPEGTTGTGKTILKKTAGIGQAILEMPKEVTDETASTILNATLRSSAEQVGIANEEKRRKVENQIEGKKILERMESEGGSGLPDTPKELQ